MFLLRDIFSLLPERSMKEEREFIYRIFFPFKSSLSEKLQFFL